MNRRGFFGLLGAVTVGAVGRPDAKMTAPPSQSPEADMDFVCGYPSPSHPRTGGGGAYRYHWTGLKSNQDWSWRVGQWLAWPTPHSSGVYRYDPDVNPPFLYVNVPGFVGGPYQPGGTFSIIGRGNRFIVPGTSEDQIHAWIAEGERYLRELMDGYADRRASRVPASLYNFPMTHADRQCLRLNL